MKFVATSLKLGVAGIILALVVGCSHSSTFTSEVKITDVPPNERAAHLDVPHFEAPGPRETQRSPERGPLVCAEIKRPLSSRKDCSYSTPECDAVATTLLRMRELFETSCPPLHPCSSGLPCSVVGSGCRSPSSSLMLVCLSCGWVEPGKMCPTTGTHR